MSKALLAVLSLLAIYYVVDITKAHVIRAQTAETVDSEAIETWWPVDQVTVDGVQPFKFVMPEHDVESYDAFWQVDGGQLNEMYNSYETHPHKEARVDLSGWTWRDNGPYLVTFIAEKNGSELAKESLVIYTGGGDQGNQQDEPAESDSSEEISAEVSEDSDEIEDDTEENDVIDETEDESNDENETITDNQDINVWWPVDGAHLSGTQPLKAIISNVDVSDYELFWTINDDWQKMGESQEDYPHKEARVDVSEWNGNNGEHTVRFRAEDHDGNVIGSTSVSVRVDSSDDNSGTTQNSGSTDEIVEPVEDENSDSSSDENEDRSTDDGLYSIIEEGSDYIDLDERTQLSGDFYDDPNDVADRQADDWRATRPDDAALMDILGEQPVATWVGGWNGNVYEDVRSTVSNAVATDTIPAFVVYNIPQRDCGQYSAGGAGSYGEYNSWIQDIARGIGSNEALVILEPDAVAGVDCLSGVDQEKRMNALSDAVRTLEGQPNTSVYLDAGNPNWHSPEEIASRLQRAGVDEAEGFALNTSNFFATETNVSYGEDISDELGGKHFVVDTSRNGRGPDQNHEWCNPAGRGLGEAPTLDTGHDLADAFLWVKMPGESDGDCNGAPGAGQWYPDYALDLIKNRAF